MEERLKKIRKELGYSQIEFSKLLNIKNATYNAYEVGRNKPTDAVIGLICKTFNVNEQWLRTGEGDMFIKTMRNQEIQNFMDRLEVEDSDFKRQFITMLCTMTEEEWQFVEKKMYELVDESRERTEEKARAKEQIAPSKDFTISDQDKGLDDTTIEFEKRSTIKSEERYRKALNSALNTDSSASNTTSDTGMNGTATEETA